MTIKIEMLRCFTAVAEGGSLSEAAGMLHRSPSAVSMMLKQFEQTLGTPLFESDRKSKLTAVGAFVLEQAQTELRQFDRTVTTIAEFARAEIGSIRIAAVPSIAAAILPQTLFVFREQFPKVRVELRDSDSANILRELHDGQIDVGIATAPLDQPALMRHTLLTDSFGIVCCKDHPLTHHKTPIEWTDLQPYPFIANELCSSFQIKEFQTIYKNAVLSVHNTVSLLAMIKADLGITVLPQMAVQINPHDTTFLPLKDPLPQRRIDLFHSSAKSRTPVAIEFCNTLIRQVSHVKHT